MPLSRPILAELYARTKADLVGLAETGGAILRRSVEWVLARIVALLAHGLYAYIDDQRKQSFPDTADEAGVRQWGGMLQLPPNPATPARGNVRFTGANSTLVPVGTEFRVGEWLYTTDAGGTISAGSLTTAATARDAGAGGNVDAGGTGSLSSPIAGIDAKVTVAAGGLYGGTDDEALEPYRGRVLDRLGAPALGGGEGDYEAWIRATPTVDVHRVWVYPFGDGVGTVVAFFTVVDAGAASGFVAATTPQVDAVQAYVDPLRPADMRAVRAGTPSPVDLALSITLALEPGADLPTVKAAAEASVAALLGAEAVPGETLALSRISEAISTTAGERSHVITSPASDPSPGGGSIYSTVTISWS